MHLLPLQYCIKTQKSAKITACAKFDDELFVKKTDYG